MKQLFLLLFFMVSIFGVANAQTNLITNGSFEDDFWPSRQPGSVIFSKSIAYAELARINDYFDSQTQPYWPKIDDTTTPTFDTEFGVWYLRNQHAYNYLRMYIDILKDTPFGNKCLTLFNTGMSGDKERNQGAYTPYQYVACQKVSLNNNKSYNLSFSYMKMDSLLGSLPMGTTVNNRTENYARRFVAGIVSSTEPSSPQNFTYVVDLVIPGYGDEEWKETTIFLDLPTLIAENPTLDFTESAIIFGLQTQDDIDSTKPFTMMPGQISIDQVSLQEFISSVPSTRTPSNFTILDRKLTVNEQVKSLKVFNMLGGLLCETSSVSQNRTVHSFELPGIYLIQIDGITSKVMVK